MRLFIAFDVSSEVAQEVSAVQQELKETAPAVSLIPSANLHLTVKFLGEVQPDRVDALKDAMGVVARSRSSFRVGFHSVGVFPSEKFITVVWVGVGVGGTVLVSLMEDLESELSSVRKEEKLPHPHLTIARVGSARDNRRIVEFVKAHQKKSFGSCVLGGLVLYQSELKPEGTVYTPLYSCMLGQKSG